MKEFSFQTNLIDAQYYKIPTLFNKLYMMMMLIWFRLDIVLVHKSILYCVDCIQFVYVCAMAIAMIHNSHHVHYLSIRNRRPWLAKYQEVPIMMR